MTIYSEGLHEKHLGDCGSLIKYVVNRNMLLKDIGTKNFYWLFQTCCTNNESGNNSSRNILVCKIYAFNCAQNTKIVRHFGKIIFW